jgi:hypothetical protein
LAPIFFIFSPRKNQLICFLPSTEYKSLRNCKKVQIHRIQVRNTKNRLYGNISNAYLPNKDILNAEISKTDLSNKDILNILIYQTTISWIYQYLKFVRTLILTLGPKSGFHLYNPGPDSPLQALGDERTELLPLVRLG